MDLRWSFWLLGVCLMALPDVAQSSCKPGFQEKGKECEDEDECLDVDRCGHHSVCFNTIGSYYCQCKEGFRSRTKHFTATSGQCKDINECFSNPCPKNSQCNNTIGSYKCVCLKGFEDKRYGATFTCSDIDECVTDPTVCRPYGVCRNTNGSFICLCPKGFRNTNQSSTPCEDIDECDEEEHVCGEDGNCVNTEGSFYCHCNPGFSNYGNNHTKCTELKCVTPNTTKEDVAVMGSLLDLFTSSCEALRDQHHEQRAGKTLLRHLLSKTDDVLSGGNLTSGSTLSVFFGTIEKTMRLIAPQLNEATTSIENNETEARLMVRKDVTPPTGRVTLESDSVHLNTSWETVVGADYPGFAFVGLVSYKSLNSTNTTISLDEDAETEQKRNGTTYQINSRVVTALTSNTQTQSLAEPITLTFRHIQEGKVTEGLNYSCVYWDEAQSGGSWSGRGCVKAKFNLTHATCTWTHLSSFAVLMALYPIQDSYELEWITRVGLFLSLVCLFLCILTFFFCHSIKGTRTTIHLHLCLCLFIANFIFLFFISSTHNRIGCALVAALLHFFYLAAFCFMLLEGVQLYRMVVLVFQTTFRPLYLFLVGYGVPLAIVAISAISFPGGYGTKRHCWLSLDYDFIWSFFAPVCIIILFNSFFFIITVWKLVGKFSSLNPDLPKLKKLRGFVLTAVAQLCVLGGMWIFGCFLFQEEGTLVMAYLFTLLNSLQGVLIFVMHCLLSKSVREEYKKLCGRACEPQKKRYSEFSTNQSSNSQRPLRSTPSTGESQM